MPALLFVSEDENYRNGMFLKFGMNCDRSWQQRDVRRVLWYNRGCGGGLGADQLFHWAAALGLAELIDDTLRGLVDTKKLFFVSTLVITSYGISLLHHLNSHTLWPTFFWSLALLSLCLRTCTTHNLSIVSIYIACTGSDASTCCPLTNLGITTLSCQILIEMQRS